MPLWLTFSARHLHQRISYAALDLFEKIIELLLGKLHLYVALFVRLLDEISQSKTGGFLERLLRLAFLFEQIFVCGTDRTLV